MKRKRIKRRSNVDQRINSVLKQLSRHEIKSAQIRLDMRKISAS